MKVTEITPKSIFYYPRCGEVHAVRFLELAVRCVAPPHPTRTPKPTNFKVNAKLQFANGDIVEIKDGFLGHQFYKTADDAVEKENPIDFTFTCNDVPETLAKCGCKPSIQDYGWVAEYCVWTFLRDDCDTKAVLRPITYIDLFRHTIGVDWPRGNGKKKWYNTSTDCYNDNQVKVVEFPDMPDPEPQDEDGLHIVFIEIVK